MSIAFLLAQPFAQHALLAAALVAVSCGLIGPFVVTRGCPSPRTEPPSWPSPVLAFWMGTGVLLLGFYQGFATAATNILFGDIFGVSGSQLLIPGTLGLVVVAIMATWYRPLLFASRDPEAG